MIYKFLSVLILINFALINTSCKKEYTTPDNVIYYPTVKAIINANCTITCHAPSMGFSEGLPVILETDEDITSRALGIKASVADPSSLNNKRMPLGGILLQKDIDVIVKWYEKGGRQTD